MKGIVISLLASLVLTSCAWCRSVADERWSFRLTEYCLDELDETADHPPKTTTDKPYCGDVDDLPLVGVVILWPVLVDLAILPVTGVHDLFRS